jgi:hypothetical protein
MEENTKQHDLEHHFFTQGNTKTARFRAQFLQEKKLEKMNGFPCAPFEKRFMGNPFSDCYRG